nr:sugar ABC transporter substrate-binding protein [uncultured Sellimonas sp.]
MKCKRWITGMLMIVLMFSLSLAACKKPAGGTPEDNPVKEEEKEENDTETYKFGFSCITMENPYYTTLEASIREDVEEAGSTLITKDPGGNAEKQIQQIREMIQEGIQAIFLSPVDWEVITPVIKELKEADVKIINLDTQVADIDDVDAYVGSDNRKAGELCGKKIIETYPEGGKIVILECTTQNSINDRITGFEETIAGDGFEVVARAETDGDKEKAKAAMEKILKEQEQITAVMCGNDQIAMGALEAVEKSGRNEMLIYGVDGSPDLKKELAAGNPLIAGTAAQSPINIGKSAVSVALQIMNGEDYEEETLEDVLFIDKDNVNMYGIDGWQ